MSRKLQKYILGREQVSAILSSGRTVEESGYFVMRSYMRKEGKKEKDYTRSYAAPFSYVEAALYLVEQPNGQVTRLGEVRAVLELSKEGILIN